MGVGRVIELVLYNSCTDVNLFDPLGLTGFMAPAASVQKLRSQNVLLPQFPGTCSS